MSWLTAKLSRVREQGGALVKDGVRALRERAGHARAVFGRGGGGVAELSADLERRARRAADAAVTVGEKDVEELLQSWVRQLGAGVGEGEKEGGARWHQLQRQREASGFRQALLRSRALELVLQAIALDPNLRRYYNSPQAWTSFGIRGLLCQVLDSSEEVWSAVLKAAFGEGELLSETELEMLLDIISALKSDWKDEDFKAERRELTLRAESLVQELRQLDVQDVGDRDIARHAKRVELSGELFGLHRALWQNVEEAEEQLGKESSMRAEAFDQIDGSLNSYAASLKDPDSGMDAQNRQLQEDLQKSHDNLQSELQRIDSERVKMDRSIEDLEAEKREFRAQLDAVNTDLRQAQADQRWHMQQCDAQHQEINSIEDEYKAQIRAEDAAILDAQRQCECLQSAMQVVSEVDAVVQETVNGQVEELLYKQTQFDIHFQEILKEHLGYEQQQLMSLQREAENCAASVQRHKAQIDMLNVMDMSTRSVIDGDEKKRLQRIVNISDVGLRELRELRTTYQDFIFDQDAQHGADVLEDGYIALQQILAPCRELIGEGCSPVQSPSPPSLARLNSTHSSISSPMMAPALAMPRLERSTTVPSLHLERHERSGPSPQPARHATTLPAYMDLQPSMLTTSGGYPRADPRAAGRALTPPPSRSSAFHWPGEDSSPSASRWPREDPPTRGRSGAPPWREEGLSPRYSAAAAAPWPQDDPLTRYAASTWPGSGEDQSPRSAAPAWPVEEWSQEPASRDPARRQSMPSRTPNMPVAAMAPTGMAQLAEQPQLPRIPRSVSPAPRPLQAPNDTLNVAEESQSNDTFERLQTPNYGERDWPSEAIAVASAAVAQPSAPSIVSPQPVPTITHDPLSTPLTRGVVAFADRAAAAQRAASPRPGIENSQEPVSVIASGLSVREGARALSAAGGRPAA